MGINELYTNNNECIANDNDILEVSSSHICNEYNKNYDTYNGNNNENRFGDINSHDIYLTKNSTVNRNSSKLQHYLKNIDNNHRDTLNGEITRNEIRAFVESLK